MKLRTSRTLLGLIILTGAIRLEAGDVEGGDLEVNGDLLLEGVVDVSGNAFYFGTNGSVPGFTSEFSLGSLPGSAPGAPQAAILRSKASLAPGGAHWTWERLINATSAWTPAMELTADSVKTTLKINGSNVLTSADLGGLSFVRSTGAVSAGSFRTSHSNSAAPLGQDSVALGVDSTASGSNTLAGANSTATGDYSVALANSTGAFGDYSAALGMGSQTYGQYSMTFGYGTAANGWGQTVLGMNNLPSGDPAATSPAETDLIFIVGNGNPLSANPARYNSNALTIRLDGGTAIGTGVTSNAPGQIVVGRHNNTATNPNPMFDKTKGVFIIGAGSGVAGGSEDAPEKQNAMRVLEDGTVLVQPHGDLSMGIFKSGPRP